MLHIMPNTDIQSFSEQNEELKLKFNILYPFYTAHSTGREDLTN